MSLIYRAIWQDDHLDGVCELATGCFTDWATTKWPTLTVPLNDVARGHATRNGEHTELEVRTTVASAPGGSIPQACRADLIETHAHSARWHTILRSWENTDSSGDTTSRWLWVDVEVVGDVDVNRLGVAAPKLVRDLLNQGASPSVDGDVLVPQRDTLVGPAAGEWLAETISRPDRTLPIIVANDCPSARATAAHYGLEYPAIVEKIRQKTAGMAATYTIDNSTGDALIEALGRSYGVWDGAIRVYLSDADPAADNAWRHRYFTSGRYVRPTFVAGKAVANHLGPVSAVRRPPKSYAVVKRILEKSGTGGTSEEMLDLAYDEIRNLEATVIELREQVMEKEVSMEGFAFDLGIATEERAKAQRAAENLERHVRSLQGQLGARDEYYSIHAINQDEEPPTVVKSISDAIDMAKTYLSDRLTIPDTALHYIEDLDASVTSVAWAQTTWDGFLALHAYAVDRADGWDNGGFWEWCLNSGNQRVWRATNKKLAMKESESVNNSTKLRQSREFPVPMCIDPSGYVYMESHLKIATGGGNLAPRIYFHFDEKRCQVHIGFFGPHKLLPNTKT